MGVGRSCILILTLYIVMRFYKEQIGHMNFIVVKSNVAQLPRKSVSNNDFEVFESNVGTYGPDV